MLIQADGLRKVKLTLCERSLVMLQKAEERDQVVQLLHGGYCVEPL